MNNMKSLPVYITESLKEYRAEKLKLSDEDKGKLVDLDVRYDKIMSKYHVEKSHFQNVTNMPELIKRYKKHCDTHDDWELTYDKIEYEHSAWENKKTYDNFMEEVDNLLNDFYEFQYCFLTKYYIDKLETVKKNIQYIRDYVTGNRYLPKYFYRPSNRLYRRALEYIKGNPVQPVSELEKKDKAYKRTIEAKDAVKMMQDEIDKQGYGWKVELDPNLVPRMSVKTYKKMLINDHCNFSPVDIESLKRHEINTHVARKYNGLKTGLYLFLYGLHGAGRYDEGMAIYNSLDKSPKPKPNILFYISKKIVLLKHLFEMSTDELVEFMMKVTNATHEDCVIAVIRAMRIVFWNDNYASSLDASYLTGYEEVRKMDDSARAELLKYNIGPDQLYDLPDIKNFLKINEFPSLI